MRRRRMSRRGERRVNRRDALEEIFEWIEGTNAPSCGWCGHPRCFECQAAHQRIRLAKNSAERAYEVGKNSHAHAAPPEPPRAHHQPYELEGAFQRGYQEATHNYAAERSRMQAEITRVSRQLGADRAPDPVMLEQARMQGYVAGVNAGRAMHQPMPQAAANTAETRKQVMDAVLNECHVIGESNPGMKPAMDALRHRVKKI